MTNKDSWKINECVLKKTREHDEKFIGLCFTDILCMLKSFVTTSEELKKYLPVL